MARPPARRLEAEGNGSTLDRFDVSDYVTLTGGMYGVFGSRGSTLGVAIGVPVTGPRPYEIEAIGSLNIRS